MNDYGERFSSTIRNGYIALGIGLGYKLGLFDALIDFKSPVTPKVIADKCNLNERYVIEWLGAMSAANFVAVKDNKYSIPEHAKPYITNQSYGYILPNICGNMCPVIQCFESKEAKGFDYSAQLDNLMWLGSLKKDYGIERVFPSTKDGLNDSIKNILDIGCGTGELSFKLADWFPDAKIYGIDIDPYVIKQADKKKNSLDSKKNVEFVQLSCELMDMKYERKFDWIVMYNVLHDLSDPVGCINAVKRVLKGDGFVSAFDPLFHSDHSENIDDPNAAMCYMISTFTCLPYSMSQKPNAGLGVGWGIEKRNEFLTSNGFNIFEGHQDQLVHFKKRIFT